MRKLVLKMSVSLGDARRHLFDTRSWPLPAPPHPGEAGSILNQNQVLNRRAG